MSPRGPTIERERVDRTPFSEDLQAAVRAELDGLLKAPIFAQSGRCKRFLNHVVNQTLAGNAAALKERMIGITVFERTNDYDTGDDSIVRVTANEVRKRLGQYYGESAGAHPIQIELPRGSYVPEFRIQAARKGRRTEGPAATEVVNGSPGSSTSAPLSETRARPAPGPSAAEGNPPERFGWKRYGAIAVLTLLAVSALLAFLRYRAASSLPDIWSSFLHPSSPVLVCIDTHQLPGSSAASREGQRFVDVVLRKQIIALDDAAVLSSMSSVLGKREIPFRVVAADQTSLADLRRQPVILIGAIDNNWTLRLTQDLPYRIEVANPPGPQTEKEPVASIVDSHDAATRWTTDLSIPFDAWKSDYAVIAKVDDPTTGVPVLMEAGLGNNGTLAASELILSGTLSGHLADQPACRGKRNFEAVIETEMIDTKSGPPHILRLACW